MRAAGERPRSAAGGVADGTGEGLEGGGAFGDWSKQQAAERDGATVGVSDAGCVPARRGDGPGETAAGGACGESSGHGFWGSFDVLPFGDGKARRVEAGTFPLAHGVSGRVGLLRGYGNAIVPQDGAEFVQAWAEGKVNGVDEVEIVD